LEQTKIGISTGRRAPQRGRPSEGPTMLKHWLARLAIGLLCLQVAAAAPESAAPSASDSAWSIERLDSLFAAHDWASLAGTLSNAKTADQFAQQMDWMRDKLMAGAGSLLGFLYSRDLWSAGQQAKSSDPMNDLRVTAALFHAVHARTHRHRWREVRGSIRPLASPRPTPGE